MWKFADIFTKISGAIGTTLFLIISEILAKITGVNLDIKEISHFGAITISAPWFNFSMILACILQLIFFIKVFHFYKLKQKRFITSMLTIPIILFLIVLFFPVSNALLFHRVIAILAFAGILLGGLFFSIHQISKNTLTGLINATLTFLIIVFTLFALSSGRLLTGTEEIIILIWATSWNILSSLPMFLNHNKSKKSHYKV